MDELVESVSRTYAWHQALGHGVEDTPLARFVSDPQHPDLWVANHVSRVRARTSGDADVVLGHADRLHAASAHRMVLVDPSTPAGFVARLALAGYLELPALLHMVLEGELARRACAAEVELREVRDEDDWRTLGELVRQNHVEAYGSDVFEASISRGIVDGYRAKAEHVQFFLAVSEGHACAYGSAVVGAYGMGIVEDLFTLPSHRRRDIASTMIAHAVAHARARGMGAMLIGAFVDDTPKALYRALGFEPVCVTRRYLLELPRVPTR